MHGRIWQLAGISALLALESMVCAESRPARAAGVVVVADPSFFSPGCAVPAGPFASQQPFGYYPTQWRTFPGVDAVLPKPIPAGDPLPPGTKQPLLRNDSPPASIVSRPLPRPKFAERSAAAQTPARVPLPDEVPIPHPATVAARPNEPARPERGFASLRTSPALVSVPAGAPAIAPVPADLPTRNSTPAITARPPVVDSGIRQTRSADEVIRPEWPKIVPGKK